MPDLEFTGNLAELLAWLEPIKWVVAVAILVLAAGWAIGRARSGK